MGTFILLLKIKKRNFYFKFGPVLNKGFENEFLLPIHLAYRFPSGKIRPKLSYGLNSYPGSIHTMGLNPGVDILFHKNLSISINGQAEYQSHEKLLLIPKETIGYGLCVGVMFKINDK